MLKNKSVQGEGARGGDLDDYERYVKEVGKFIKKKYELHKDEFPTQKDLADKVGVSPAYISHFFSGNKMLSYKYLIKAAELLKFSMDEIHPSRFGISFSAQKPDQYEELQNVEIDDWLDELKQDTREAVQAMSLPELREYLDNTPEFAHEERAFILGKENESLYKKLSEVENSIFFKDRENEYLFTENARLEEEIANRSRESRELKEVLVNMKKEEKWKKKINATVKNMFLYSREGYLYYQDLEKALYADDTYRNFLPVVFNIVFFEMGNPHESALDAIVLERNKITSRARMEQKDFICALSSQPDTKFDELVKNISGYLIKRIEDLIVDENDRIRLVNASRDLQSRSEGSGEPRRTMSLVA